MVGNSAVAALGTGIMGAAMTRNLLAPRMEVRSEANQHQLPPAPQCYI